MRALIILVVLALAGAVVWHFATGDEKLRVGVSADKPLGDPDKIEAHLLGIGLKKGPIAWPEVRDFFPTRFPDQSAVDASEYYDSVANLKHRIVMVRGKDGRL